MSANRLYIAAAGSGKTKLIVDNIHANTSEKTLITTFTTANEQSIRERLTAAYGGCIPSNIVVQTWFSFLIEHGVRPYRFWDERVTGMQLVSTKSGFRYKLRDGTSVYWGEQDFLRHYFNSAMDVYSDKLSKLVLRCNKESGGYVIKRLEKIFQHIYIDEVQDMAGWDLEVIKLILKSSISLTMVGDPRQTVYQTHHDGKYPSYKYGKIKDFLKEKCTTKKEATYIDEETLTCSYRNSEAICVLSSSLYPTLPLCSSALSENNPHMGIYFVPKQAVKKYHAQFLPMQLRLRKDVSLHVDAPCLTFGESKGLEYEHVLIYPTNDMLKWFCGQNVKFADKTRAQLYVALTRAFYSVGIVVDDDFNKVVDGIPIWNRSEIH